jgi:fructokinase
MVAGEADVSLAQARTFHKAPGGAPANVAVGIVRLGQSAGFIGAVGSDPFGEFLHQVIAGAGVDASHLARIDNARTSLAFIASRSDAGKDIAFWRNPGADMMLAPQHISRKYVEQAMAFHFGSISRIDESPRQATDQALALLGTNKIAGIVLNGLRDEHRLYYQYRYSGEPRPQAED